VTLEEDKFFSSVMIFFVSLCGFHPIKTEKGWKIDRFKFTLKFIDGNKDLEQYAPD
jgi:hypothetical protein